MKVDGIKAQILPLLDKPKSVYDLAIETDYSTATLNNWLRILQAGGFVNRIENKANKPVLWFKTDIS